MDIAGILGLLIGLSAIIGGNILEGGKSAAILQLTAAVIVLGGTLGATMLSYPMSYLLRAAGRVGHVFSGRRPDSAYAIREMVEFSSRVRRKGLISMEPEIESISDPFMRRGLKLAIDGIAPSVLRETMEQETRTYEDEALRVAKVFETAGGFAPTIGILGAVLGLIEVMRNLADPARLGAGIAVAFVATLYGVGLANLVLLPFYKKLLNLMEFELAYREMVIEGVLAIQSGMNPRYLEEKLRAHVPSYPGGLA